MQASTARPRFNPALVLLVGVLAVSSGAIFVRLSDAPSLVTAAWRLTFATLLLLPYALWKARGELRQLARREVGLGALAGFFLALHFATWISSLNFTSVANSTVLVNTTPVWVALLTPWLTRDRVTGRAWLGLAASVAGGIGIGLGGFAGGTRALIGDGLALVGSLAGDFMSDAMINEMTAVGGLILIGLGLTLLDIKKPRVVNFLPGLLIAPLIVTLATALGINIYP